MPPPTTSPSPTEVLAALQRGGVIEALKLVIAAKSSGVKGEKILGGHFHTPSKPASGAPLSSKASDLSPGEVPRSNKDVWLLLVLIAALSITYYFFAG